MSEIKTEDIEDEVEIYSLEKILSLLENGYVINLRNGSLDWGKTHCQYRIDENQIVCISFDSFGIRLEPVVVDKETLLKNCTRWSENNYRGWSALKTYFFTSHKKRVSARSKNPDIVDELVSKCHLYKYLIDKFPNGIIVPEITFAARRADFVVFFEGIHIYEIKSEVDSLERLPEQIKEYKKYGTTVTIAVHPNKLKYIPNDKTLGLMILHKDKIIHKRKAKEYLINPSVFKYLFWSTERDKIMVGIKGKTELKNQEKIITFLKEGLNNSTLRMYFYEIFQQRYYDEHIKRLKILAQDGVEKAVSEKREYNSNKKIKFLPIIKYLEKKGIETPKNIKKLMK